MSKDREVMKLALRMRRHAEALRALTWKIEESGHPNAEPMKEYLRETELEPIADPVHVVWRELEHPALWDKESGKYRKPRAGEEEST